MPAHASILAYGVCRYTQRPDRKGTERSQQDKQRQLQHITVTLKDPIERGLKVARAKRWRWCIFLSYTQRPDRKGTERTSEYDILEKVEDYVTLKDPIERGLKDLCRLSVHILHPRGYTQRPDRKGTERCRSLIILLDCEGQLHSKTR